MTSRRTRVAVVQACTVNGYDTQATLPKLAILAREASQQGATLAVFPEAFLGGYPVGSNFGTRFGERTCEGKEEFVGYFKQAIELPGPEATFIADVARENNLFIVVGVIERCIGTLYCTVIFVDPSKGLVAKHRKLMPTCMERIVWGQGDGSTMPILDVPLKSSVPSDQGRAFQAKIGAAICWENYMPLFRYNLYAQGIQLYCAPTAEGRDFWISTMQHIAVEGRCYVLGSNQFARQKDFPEGHPFVGEANPDGVMHDGGSIIVAPTGEILAGPLREQEGVLVAEIDLDEMIKGKFEFDCVGHYSRPDIFQLSVNERQNSVVKRSV
ncbi:nitrilase [Basidiobolus meristosporus CBS 931.73]|uniref:Nitrilase n=1 Tax=Basidiobolus meristosporus CBS 931.73 TaxID=1314790 RepID=A0A1Y1YA02_9FUNG|nr:nitrilase [Basidiobolus meristosporus CBS 931.73]|eukprot:ORX94808.1 nitrilase [Basidiobolus meristosporus CBS 931.73]